MVDAVTQTQPLQPFTTIKYMTKDGEAVTATKKDGIVTLVGDKNGVRQIPLEDFITKELPNIADLKLEKSPETDTVEISQKSADTKVVAETKPEPAEPKQQETVVGQKLDVAA
ncbi:hypothetical protein IJ541_08430 [bacterium]|nr:hypothetical protein [bacterium]